MSNRAILIIVLSVFVSSCGKPIQLAPDAILPDGGVYQGEIKDGVFHGRGTLTYPDGQYYVGQFENGVYHGPGELVFADGSRYVGEFQQGQISGRFLVQSTKDSFKYDGELLNAYMHGQGSLTGDNYVYQGEFESGKFEGHGKITYDNGIVYEGGFVDGLYDGEGVYVGDDGSQYEGQFKQNYYDGQGTITYQNGAVYEGRFKAGKFHGQGRYSYQETWYQGEYRDGELSGQGEYLDDQGHHYIGDVKSWRAHGQGRLTQADGALLVGRFEYGILQGDGERTSPDGDFYKGGFEYGEYDGSGELKLADGSVYKGQFSYGRYHGEGTLTTVNQESDEQHSLSGRWRRGELAFNSKTGERQHAQADLALENHQLLLEKSLAAIETGDEKTNVYFLGVAGDGSQSVFRRELEYVSTQIQSRYNTDGRSVLLINHHDTAEIYPMATSRSISKAISAIGRQMDNEDDILLMYLSSHGDKNHDFYLNHDSIRLPDISPTELKLMLDTAKVKWRVILVSACYSGGYISELENDYTLVMTAADSNSQSFGCSEDSEMTYFGKALFKEVLSKNRRIPLSQAFGEAKEIILKWEKEQELDASNPMMSAPAKIVEKMLAF